MVVSGPVGIKVLRPIHPNIGIEYSFRRAIWGLLDEIHWDIIDKLRGAYTEIYVEPIIALDRLASTVLKEALNLIVKRWMKRFNDAAPKLAKHFTLAIADRSDSALREILREGGWSVKFKMTTAMRDAMNASIHEQVSLIKSIPQQYLGKVEVLVMTSIQTGRTLSELTDELHKQFGITRRRAALIARDQNNKATATLTRVRQKEAGIEKAMWRHSHAGKEPRPTHVKASRDRVIYDINKGWFDPHEQKYIFPGELINCRCFSVPVIPGFD